ncbi:MAG: HAD family phosphatase [Patescibacteria group bacterium]|jgi:HAD superfamily hydrolase (TIGR01509 family)
MNKNTTAIIFDFNGVLLWDAEQHKEAWNIMAVKLRNTPFTDEELAEHMYGRVNRDIIAYLLRRAPTPKETAVFIEEKESMYRAIQQKRGSAFALSPGAIPFLDVLKEQNIPRTIATSSEIVNVRFFFAHLDLARWFSFEDVVYDDGVRNGKPAPDIYLAAAEHIGIIPQQCMVIEDASSGIAAAHAAEIGRIIALGPAERHAALAALPGVDDVITTLAEININELL